MKAKAVPAAVLIFTVLFLIAAFHDLSLPGIWYDEALQLVPTIRILGRGAPFYFHGYSSTCDIGGITFPIMTINYLGALKSYLFIPFYLIFGVSPLGIRLGGILAGLIVLLFAFLITKKLFRPEAAVIATALLCLDPSFVLFFRTDMGPVAVQITVKMLSFWLLLLWLDKPRFRLLGTALFLMGIGLFDKANFALYIAALGVSFLLFCRKSLPFLLKMNNILAGGALFCLGAAPLLIQEIKTRGSLLKPLIHPFVSDSRYLTKPIGWKGSLLLLENTLNSRWIQDFVCLRVGYISWFPFLCLVCIIMVPLLAGMGNRKAYPGGVKKISGVLFLAALIWVLVSLCPGTWGAHHYLLLYPFPHIFCAAVLAWPFRTEYHSRWKKSLICATVMAILIVMVTNVLSLYGYYRNLEQGYSSPRWSPVISDLTEYFMEIHPRKIICVDWGLHNSIILLSNGSLKSQEIFWHVRDKGEDFFRDEIEALVQKNRRGIVFLLYAPPVQFDDKAVEIFREWIEKQKPGSFSKKVFFNRRGMPLYELYSFGRKSPL